MKYTVEVTVESSIEETVEAFFATRDFSLWQEGFQHYDLKVGGLWQVGAIAEIAFVQNGQKIELKETILENRLPDQLQALYEHKHMDNLQTTSFVELTAEQTKIVSQVEYLKFKGLMPKLMAKLFPKMFEKQSLKRLQDFKHYIEKN